MQPAPQAAARSPKAFCAKGQERVFHGGPDGLPGHDDAGLDKVVVAPMGGLSGGVEREAHVPVHVLDVTEARHVHVGHDDWFRKQLDWQHSYPPKVWTRKADTTLAGVQRACSEPAFLPTSESNQ